MVTADGPPREVVDRRGRGAVGTRADEPGGATGWRAGGPGAQPGGIDHAAVFTAMPTPYLVLTPDLVIADANPAYLASTGRELAELVGRDVFEAFPGNPNEVDPDGGLAKVRASLERARDTGRPHTMSVQEYDIADGGRVRGECGMGRPEGPCRDR